MLKVKVDADVLEFDEGGIDGVETDVRAVIAVNYSANKTDRIWRQIKDWATEWDNHPASGEYAGWNAVVAEVAETLRVLPSNTAKTTSETWAKLVLKLKRAWVDISLDPTEDGQESNSLYAVSLKLREVLLEIHADQKLVGVLNTLIPTVFTVSNNYLGGTYGCHHNPAKEIRDTLSGFEFTSFLSDVEDRSDRERYMATDWEQLAFSSRL